MLLKRAIACHLILDHHSAEGERFRLFFELFFIGACVDHLSYTRIVLGSVHCKMVPVNLLVLLLSAYLFATQNIYVYCVEM